MNALLHKRQQILQQMERIQRMERGSLQSETGLSLRHPEQDRGPYFQHQIWENGHNKTRRIPPDKADALGQAIAGRKGKQPDGSAKTREAKLACVFLQTEVDKDGHPIRKEDSTRYIGSFEGAVEFGLLLRQEAQRRGMAQAAQIIFIGDGAAWIWELARVNFPAAVLILDFCHALQHVHGLVEAIWGKESPEGKKRIKRWKGWLLKDKVRELVKQAKENLTSALDPEKAQKEIGYLENNLERMAYGPFRKAGYFIGSGVVEAGCKTVIGQRMKCAGMFWSEEGGQGMLDLRCAFLSNRLDAFCQARTVQHAARNDLRQWAA